MNNQTQENKTAAIAVMIAIIAVYANMDMVSTVSAQQEAFMPYGSIAQEDELYVQDNNGIYWVNTGTAYGVGNGMFEAINEINDNFNIDGAVKTFGINEDVQEFIYEPVLSNGEYSNVLFMYQLVSENNFELTHIYADESGLNQEITELENNQ